MRRDYLTIVLGMAFMGGAVTGIVIYVGNLFMPHPVIAAVAPTDTLPAPKAVTVIPPTATIAPTSTAAPTPTAEPVLRARLSHYWPPYGPPNCHSENWTGTECTTYLTDGRIWEHWSYWENIGVACPVQYPMGTKFKIDGFGSGIWTCVDRGGAISVLNDEEQTFFLDLLTREQPYIPPSEAEVIYDQHSPHGSLVVTVTIMD